MCPSCRSSDLFQVTLNPDGEAVPFSTCRQCEHRWWGEAERAIELGEVLTRLS